MFYLLTVLILIASIALVLLVIVQKSKGGGLASPFASTNNIMGVRKTTDVLEKATWWLFGIVAVLCIASSHFLGTGTDADSKTQQVLEQNAAKGAAPTALPALGGGAAPQQGAPAAAPAPAAPAPAPAPAPVQVQSLTRNVFFLINSAKVRPSEIVKVNEVVNYLKQNPNAKVSITGYADRGTGNAVINSRLSKQRANAVFAELVKRNIAANRIIKDAKGDTVQPFAVNDQNRVVICIAE